VRFTNAIATLLFAATLLPAADPVLAIDITVADGTSDNPMIVLWVETDKGDFVKTIQMMSKDKKYYKDILTWWKARDGKEASLDGLVGATIAWNGTRHLDVPIKSGAVNLLAGNLVLRAEQRKDKGGHYKSLKIPLPANFTGGTLDAATAKGLGYIKTITLAVR
jgi:hypothetical protein